MPQGPKARQQSYHGPDTQHRAQKQRREPSAHEGGQAQSDQSRHQKMVQEKA
jgi:hypothetical protein